MKLTLNEWFLSLEKPRQAILKQDKWMLADAAFQAGAQRGAEQSQEALDAKQREIDALHQQLAALKPK